MFLYVLYFEGMFLLKSSNESEPQLIAHPTTPETSWLSFWLHSTTTHIWKFPKTGGPPKSSSFMGRSTINGKSPCEIPINLPVRNLLCIFLNRDLGGKVCRAPRRYRDARSYVEGSLHFTWKYSCTMFKTFVHWWWHGVLLDIRDCDNPLCDVLCTKCYVGVTLGPIICFFAVQFGSNPTVNGKAPDQAWKSRLLWPASSNLW